MAKGSIKRGLPSRFVDGEVARLPTESILSSFHDLKLVVIRERAHNHHRNPCWKATYLIECARDWIGFHTVKESDLTKVVWTFTGFVDKPSERL